jgi:urease gamma subunit
MKRLYKDLTINWHEAVLIISALQDAIKHDEKLNWYRTQKNELNTMRDLIDEIVRLFPDIERDIGRQS